jgi:hypothetical protein
MVDHFGQLNAVHFHNRCTISSNYTSLYFLYHLILPTITPALHLSIQILACFFPLRAYLNAATSPANIFRPNTPPHSTHSSNAYPSTSSVTVNLYVLNTILSYSSRPAALAFLCHGPNPPLNASSLLCQKPVLTVSYLVTISTTRVAIRKVTWTYK